MRRVAAPIRVGDLRPRPMPEQENLAAGGRIHRQHRVAVMLFHDQNELGPAQVLEGQLAGPVWAQVDATRLHQRAGGFFRRMVDQGSNTRGTRLNQSASVFDALAEKKLGRRATTDVAGADRKDPLEHR